MLITLGIKGDEASLLTLINSNQTPSYRQAYSDRTAWLMACLSELAYQPFGRSDAESIKELLQEKLNDLLREENKESFDKLVATMSTHDLNATSKFKSEFDDWGITLEEIYDHEGTQAFLASTSKYLVLAFRGTEATSFADIKSDLNAKITPCDTSGGIHSGFNDAYDKIAVKIQHDLNDKKFAEMPLIITGHSLGGALATVGSKKLKHEGGIAACYTFGSPRVGNEQWSHGIKTPIYRVVNAVDCVTMVPPSGVITEVASVVLGFLPYVGKIIKKLLANVKNYSHVGDMRYLTNCKPDKFDNVELEYSVGVLRRMRIFLKGARVSKFVKDHSISVYRKKLAVIALRNNSDKV